MEKLDGDFVVITYQDIKEYPIFSTDNAIEWIKTAKNVYVELFWFMIFEQQSFFSSSI